MNITTRKTNNFAVLSFILAFFVLISSAIGIFGDEIYAVFAEASLQSDAKGQDLVALISIVFLLISIISARNGSLMGYLTWMGFLLFYFYAYAIYAFNGFYSSLFIFYLIITGLSFYALVGLFSSIDFLEVRKYITSKLPNRITGIFFIITVIVLIPVWLSIVIKSMQEFEIPPSNALYVLDLSIIFPAYILAALWLWKQRVWGYVLGAVLLIKSITFGFTFLFGQLFKFYAEVDINPYMLWLFVFYTLAGLVLLFFFRRNLTPINQPEVSQDHGK